jgi:hypothetical protein
MFLTLLVLWRVCPRPSLVEGSTARVAPDQLQQVGTVVGGGAHPAVLHEQGPPVAFAGPRPAEQAIARRDQGLY